MNRLPATWVIVAPTTHPVDGEPGVVVRMGDYYTEAFWTESGAIRSLPWWWRSHPPDRCGLAIARALAGRLAASRELACDG